MSRRKQEIVCAIKQYRQERGWSQEDLARKLEVRRQAVYDMESGRYLPNTAVALRLAKVFDCRVEDLFSLPVPDNDVPIRLAGSAGSGVGESSRLALGVVRGELVGVPLGGAVDFSLSLRPADALLNEGGQSARLLISPEELGKTLLLMGCDPALELLGTHIERLLPSARVRRLFASSRKALLAVAAGEAHVAATHFHGETETGAGIVREANVEAARRAMSGQACRVMGFSLMEEGLLTARGNPLGIREAVDLTGKGVRFVNRESGAALRRLLEDQLRQAGVPFEAVQGFDRIVRTHAEGAFNVACGAADAALGLRVVAEAFGLHFAPLAITRCDLVLPLDLENNPAVLALLEALQASRLRRELGGLPGYDGSFVGTQIAILS